MKVGERLLNNHWLALVVVFLASSLPLTGWIAGLILVLITLHQGIGAGARVMGVGLLGVLISSLVLTPMISGEPADPSVISIFLHLPPLFLMALVLRMRISLSQALIVGAGYYIVFAIALSLMDMLPLPEVLMKSVGQQLEQVLADPGVDQSSLTQEEKQQTLLLVRNVVVGMSYSWIAILYLSNAILLFVGRSWQARLFNPGGFRSEFHNLRLPAPTLAIAVLLALTVTYSSHIPFLIVVCGVVACVLLIFPGLSLIHWYVHYKKRSVIWLIVFYMLFALSPIGPMLIAITLTIVDTFVDVRQRIQKKS